jgi:hypothetical protein
MKSVKSGDAWHATQFPVRPAAGTVREATTLKYAALFRIGKVTGEPTPTGVQIADGPGFVELNNVPVGGIHEMIIFAPDWEMLTAGGCAWMTPVLLV